jgi:hypothetical protein
MVLPFAARHPVLHSAPPLMPPKTGTCTSNPLLGKWVQVDYGKIALCRFTPETWPLLAGRCFRRSLRTFVHRKKSGLDKSLLPLHQLVGTASVTCASPPPLSRRRELAASRRFQEHSLRSLTTTLRYCLVEAAIKPPLGITSLPRQSTKVTLLRRVPHTLTCRLAFISLRADREAGDP